MVPAPGEHGSAGAAAPLLDGPEVVIPLPTPQTTAQAGTAGEGREVLQRSADHVVARNRETWESEKKEQGERGEKSCSFKFTK